MKNTKYRIYLIINMAYLIITGVLNLIGYFKLPKEINTQFSFSGEAVNRMPTPIYLLITFGIVLMLTLFSLMKGQEQKLKYTLGNTIIVIANIVMIAIQL